MIQDLVVEKIDTVDGTLIICRKYMAIQTKDGLLHPADMDEYGRYLPIWELIRLLSYNADLSGEITSETRNVLQQTLLGRHAQLSHILYCNSEDADTNQAFLDAIDPHTKDDYVRVFSLIYSGFAREDVDIPFLTREDLRNHLRHYLNEDDAHKLSEAVRKSLFWAENPRRECQHQKYKDALALLPKDTVNAFSRIKYLPEKSLVERIIHYAILAANSLIKNNNEILLQLY